MKTKGMFFAACVLAFAATATAGLQFMVNGKVVQNGDYLLSYPPTTFSIANDEQIPCNPLSCPIPVGFVPGLVTLDRAEFGQVTLLPGVLPGIWSILDLSADLGKPAMFIEWLAPPRDGYFMIGKFVDFEIQWQKHTDSIQIHFSDSNFEPVFSVTLFTPEPATLALLGLGALMIHRKQSA